MKDNTLLNNIWFRLIVPFFYGLIVYLLILLIFDSLSKLQENFLGQEAVLTIALTYILFSALGYTVNFFERHLPLKDALKRRITFQFSIGIITSLLLTSLVLILYFRLVLGYSVFTRELIVFNSIFMLSGIFYNLFDLSLIFLHKENDTAIKKERSLNNSLYEDFKQYQRDIHPEFFFSGLETLIILMRTDKNNAQKFIDKFSAIYRYFIDNRLIELINLSSELEHTKNVLSIFDYKYKDNLIIKEKLDSAIMNRKVVPCSLHMLLEEALFSNIINEDVPLEISISNTGDKLLFEYNALRKIMKNNYAHNFEVLKRTYSYYSDETINKEIQEDRISYSIPLLTIDDKNLIE